MWDVFCGNTGAGGAGGVGGDPPPVHEYMGCEVNLLSANKNQEGKGAGGQAVKGKATDGWLGGMPGLKSFAPIFKAQTESESDASSTAESESETEAESESTTDASSESDSSSETKSETDTVAEAKSESATEK